MVGESGPNTFIENMRNKPSEILISQAAQWYARLHAPDCSEAERDAFKAWLRGSHERENAYRSVIDADSLVSSQLASDPRMQAMLSDALGDSANTSTNKNVPEYEVQSRRAVFRYAAAAAVIVIGIALSLSVGGVRGTVEDDPTEHYANNELIKQRIVLSDGSVVYLDAGSKLAVTMRAGERRIDMGAGRALFEVAHDKSRPFSVNSAGVQVVALGTQFQVEVIPAEKSVNVALVEGSVAVTNSAAADTWREVLKPGQELIVDNLLARHQVVSVNADAVTSWSKGYLVFDGVPLHKVLDEINRYSKVKVLLGDGSIASVPIAGNFIAGGDTDAFVETLTTVLPLRSTRTGANEIALFHRYEASNN